MFDWLLRLIHGYNEMADPRCRQCLGTGVWKGRGLPRDECPCVKRYSEVISYERQRADAELSGMTLYEEVPLIPETCPRCRLPYPSPHFIVMYTCTCRG